MSFLKNLDSTSKQKIDEIKNLDKKMIMQSLSTCIQMERSLTLTILGDQEILLEAFIMVIFYQNKQKERRRNRILIQKPGSLQTKQTDKIESKKEVFKIVLEIFHGRNLVISAFKYDIFPLPKQPQHEKW